MQIIKHAKPVAAILSTQPQVTNATVRSTPAMNNVLDLLDISFPPMHNVAQANTWHINKYYYQASENQWYVVEGANTKNKISTFVMRPVDEEDGRPIGERVSTSGDLWADRFADRPFNVRKFLRGQLPTIEEWFNTLVADKDVFQQLELFEGYESRLRYCSSFEALVRLGIVAA
jgi:hypothetical protein